VTEEIRIRDLSEAAKLLSDMELYGCGFVDEDGCRVDPAQVVIAPIGACATDGRRVFKSVPFGTEEWPRLTV